MALPHYPGFLDATLSPLLVLQISLSIHDPSPSLPVATMLWQHLEHVYGTFNPHLVSAAAIHVTMAITNLLEGLFCEHPGEECAH